MSTFDYTNIFRNYNTSENIPFSLLTRAVNLPDDLSLEIYDTVYNDKDIAWTVLSYRLYGTISYWWLLSALNKNYMFYAPQGKSLYYIKSDYINDVIDAINEEI